MNNSDLSYKLKYILRELKMNKKELLEECRKYNPGLSKPTLLNAINGKNKNTPSIETLGAIINVCKMSGNPKLKYISFDFLLNENIQEVNANNAAVYQEIGLSDDVINRLKQYNTPIIYDYMSIVNYFLYHTPIKYWQYLDMLKRTYDIKNNINDTKKILKLFDEGWYLLYLEENFKNIYDLYMTLKNNEKVDLNKLNKLLDILIINLKYILNGMLQDTYESMNFMGENEKIKTIKINDYNKLENLKRENEFIVDLTNASQKNKMRVIDFLGGLTFTNGNLNKISVDTYKVKVNKEDK